MKFFSFLCLLLVFGLNISLSSEFSKPVSFNVNSENLKSINEIETFFTNTPNFERINFIEDSLNSLGVQHPEFYGYNFDFNLNFREIGTIDTLRDGNYLWRYKVICPGAYSVNFLFEEFKLSENAHISFYNEEKDYVLGPYSSRINNEYQIFTSHLIYGESVFIEIFIPNDEYDQVNFAISKIVYGYKDFSNSDFEDLKGNSEAILSASCHRDVKCPEGEDFCREIYSVAKVIVILEVLSGYCSGSLINNALNDYKPYFLTAFHCLDEDNNSFISQKEKNLLTSWNFQFGYYREGCGWGVTYPTYEYSGAEFVSGWDDTDFLLTELLTQPQSGENNFRDVHFSGWDRSGNVPSSVTSLHHPQGDRMKISQKNSSPTTNNNYWDVDWDTGTTEGGSSGCPLFNEKRLVVGQNLGQPPPIVLPCHPNKRTIFGKLSLSWDGGGTSDTRLKDWLDPFDTGITELEGIHMPHLKYGWNVNTGQVFNWNAYSVFKIGSSHIAPFTVHDGAELNMKAGKEILIRPCTKIKSSSNFHAYIEDLTCDELVSLSDKESKYDGNICGTGLSKATVQNHKVEYESILNVSPNPFNETATIRLSLPESSNLSIQVVDMLGNQVHEFANNEFYSVGEYTFTLSSDNLTPGMYYLQLTTEHTSLTEPIILMK